MSEDFHALLSYRLLAHNLADFLPMRSLERARLASKIVKGHLEPPEVPAALLEPVPCHLHIKREMTLTRLQALARRKSGRALRAIVERLQDKDECDHLRIWTLNSVAASAERGDAWAIKAILGPGGPLECGGNAVKEKALKILADLAIEPSSALVSGAARVLAYASKAKDCQPLRAQARAALEQFAKQAAGRTTIDGSTMSELLALLYADGVDVRCSAIRALAVLTPRGSAPVLRGLLKALQRQGREKSGTEQLCAVKALGRVACKGDNEVIQALQGCISERDCSFLGGQLPQAVLVALEGLTVA